MKKIPALLLSTALLSPLPAAAQSTPSKRELAEGYVRQLNETLFMAGEKADVAAAKKLADKLIELHISGVSCRMLTTVYACAAAGTPAPVTEDELRAMKKNFHSTITFSPNKNMKYATAFANGWGVKTDLKHATAFACHANTYPLELIIQTEALDMMADWQKDGTFAKRNLSEPFTFCSFAQAASHVGHCDVHKVALEQYRNETEQMQLAKKAGFNKDQLKALQNLDHAAAMFFQEQVWKEYPRGGADAGSRFARRVTVSNASLNRHIMDFIHGDLLAHLPPTDLQNAAAALNQALQSIYAHKGDAAYFPAQTSAEMLHDTQFFWGEYRDAWLALFRARYPDKDTSALENWLDTRRVQQIQIIYSENHSPHKF